MALFNKKDIESNWEIFQQSLLKLRGQGLWRGHELYLREQNLIRFPFESLNKASNTREVHVHMSEKLEEIYASYVPGDTQIFLLDFELNVDKFLSTIVQEVRQRTYIRTYKDKTTYRKS